MQYSVSCLLIIHIINNVHINISDMNDLVPVSSSIEVDLLIW